jgi:glycosyltransferase involved in cell wall biosynthesis
LSFPTVSVVITTHNRALACEQAIASVLAQGTPVLEVIVCDDASSDDTPQRVAAIAQSDSRVRLERFETPRGGPAAGRNRGIAVARGDWVAFLDDDDTWLPDKLARQLAAAADATVVAGNARRASDDTPYFPGHRDTWPTLEDLRRDNPIILSTAMVRREALRDGPRFDERSWLAGIEDYAFWLHMAERGATFLVLADELVRYEDVQPDRYGVARLRGHRQLIGLALERWLRRPAQVAELGTAVRRTADLLALLRRR